MNNCTTKLCTITSGREEFICLNEQCLKQNKKQLHCYECITKLHRKENKNIIQHIDDFKKVDLFMNDFNTKTLEKVVYLNQQLNVCNDFKKEKFQQIEKYSYFPTEFLDTLKVQVDKDVEAFISYLGEFLIGFNKLSEYSSVNHNQIISNYLQTKQTFCDQIEKKKLMMEQKVVQFLSRMNLDLNDTITKLKQKQQELENKVSQFQKQSTFSSSFGAKIIIIPLLVFICIGHILILNEKHKDLSTKFDQFEQYIGAAQIEFDSKLKELRSEFANTVQNKIDSVQDSLNQISHQMNKTETPYSQFKQFFTNKLVQYNETIFEFIDDKFTQVLGSNLWNEIVQEQKRIKANLTETFTQQLQEVEKKHELTLNSTQEIKLQIRGMKYDFLLLSDLYKYEKQQMHSNILSVHNKLVQHQREKLKDKLVGKIHVDLNIKELDGFLIIYDQLLNVPFNRSIVAQVRSGLSNQTILCIGGQQVSQKDVINVIACDYPPEIFEFTYHWQHARKSSSGDIYWYMAYPVAFGFSPTEEIHLTLCDDLDPTDQRRLSYWFENGKDGGRRIGNQTQLVNSLEYKMIMYAL